MAAGSVFRLICNDGASDIYLDDSTFMKNKIKQIMEGGNTDDILADYRFKVDPQTVLVQKFAINVYKLVDRAYKLERAHAKLNYECCLDMLRLRARDVNAGVRNKMI